MALVRWDPFSELASLQRDMSRVLSRLSSPFTTWEEARIGWTPTCDVFTRGEDLVVRAELPGVRPEDCEISVTDKVLTIKGERKESSEAKEGDYFMKESSYGSFERRVTLPEGIHPDDIKAEYEDGVLEVIVPKAAAITAPHKKTIPIEAKREHTGGKAA